MNWVGPQADRARAPRGGASRVDRPQPLDPREPGARVPGGPRVRLGHGVAHDGRLRRAHGRGRACPPSIVGSYGPGPFHIAVCVEYDALPAVGHACGHNVIAAAGVGAGLALAAVADQLGLKVTVMGTPAEETGGGKVGLIKAGEFDGVHAAMMVHPWPQDEATPTIIAIRSLNVDLHRQGGARGRLPLPGHQRGRRARRRPDRHRAPAPAAALDRPRPRHRDQGRRRARTSSRPAPRPSGWSAAWTSRAWTRSPRMVRRCFEAGALATGATLEIEEEICYADVRHDADLVAPLPARTRSSWAASSATPGMPVSTDMGNVSYVVPTIHPMIGIEANGAVNHQADFAAACATPSADQAIFDGALAMAWTAIDAAQDAALRERLMAFVADPAEVAMVSSAWMMPPLPGVRRRSPPAAATEEGWSPWSRSRSRPPTPCRGRERRRCPRSWSRRWPWASSCPSLIDGPMEGQVLFLGADPDAERRRDAICRVDADAAARRRGRAVDPDAAWAADVRADRGPAGGRRRADGRRSQAAHRAAPSRRSRRADAVARPTLVAEVAGRRGLDEAPRAAAEVARRSRWPSRTPPAVAEEPARRGPRCLGHPRGPGRVAGRGRARRPPMRRPPTHARR